MELRHFVYGKFSTRFPEFGTMVADPAYDLEDRKGEYKAVQEFIINKLDALLYGHTPYSFAVCPEILLTFNGHTLYIKFFPPLPDQRGTQVAPLFHCFLLDEAELHAVKYNPWTLRHFFVEQYEQLAIIGYDGSLWLSQEEASRGRPRVIKIETTGTAQVASGTYARPGSYTDYYQVAVIDAIAALLPLGPEQKLSLFASGVLLNGDAELLQRFSNKAIHFVFTDVSIEPVTAGYSRLSGNQLSLIIPDGPLNEMGHDSPATEIAKPKASEAAYPKYPVAVPEPDIHTTEPATGNEIEIAGSRFSEEIKLRLAEYMPTGSARQETRDSGITLERIEAANAGEVQFHIGNENIFAATIIISKSAIDMVDALCGSFQMKGRSVKEFIDTRVEDGKNYLYQVKAIVNDVETIQTLLINMPPRPINQLNYSRSKTGRDITLKWMPSLNDFPISYRLTQVTTDATGNTAERTEMISANHYTDKQIPEYAISIKYRICAENTTTGQTSPSVETTTIDLSSGRNATNEHLSPANTPRKLIFLIRRRKSTLIILALLLVVALLVLYIIGMKAGVEKTKKKGGRTVQEVPDSGMNSSSHNTYGETAGPGQADNRSSTGEADVSTATTRSLETGTGAQEEVMAAAQKKAAEEKIGKNPANLHAKPNLAKKDGAGRTVTPAGKGAASGVVSPEIERLQTSPAVSVSATEGARITFPQLISGLPLKVEKPKDPEVKNGTEQTDGDHGDKTEKDATLKDKKPAKPKKKR